MASSSSAWRTLCASAVLVAVAFVCMEVHRSHRAELLDIKYGLPDNEQDYQLTDKDVNDVVSNTGITFSVTRPRSSKAKKPVAKSTDDQVIMNFKQIETAALADLNRLEAEDRNSKGRTMTLHEEHEYSGLHHLGVNTGEGPMGSYWDSKFDHEEDTHPKGKHVVRSNGKLKEAGVNTGEDEERWMDEAIEPKQKMPAGIFEEPKTLKHHSQPEEEAASVDSVPKLEKMGVNTGERKAQWNDAISETKDVKEGAYQFGVPDGRKEIPEEEEGEEEGEEKPAEEEGETEGEGEEAEGEEAAKAVKMPQLHTARAPSKKGSAHQFFEKMVAPAMQHARAASSSSSPAVPSDPAVVKEAAPYMKQVNSVAKEAKAVAAAAAAKEHQALEAVKEDNLAAKMAQAVAQAKVAAAATEASLQAKVESFEHQLARARNIIPGARKANLKSTVPGPATVTPTPPKVAKSQADTEEVAAGHGPATMAGHIDTAATKAGHIDTAATKAGHIDTAAKKNKAKAKAHGMAQQAHGETRALELAAAAFPAAPHAHVTAPQPTHALSATKAQRAVAQLEKDVAADRKENKALSSAADIDGFLSSVNTPKGHVSAKKEGHVSAKSKGQSLHSAPVTYSKAAGTAKKVAGPKVVAHDNLKAQAGLKAHKEGMKLKGGIKTQGLAIKASYMCSFTFWGMRPLCPSSGASV